MKNSRSVASFPAVAFLVFLLASACVSLIGCSAPRDNILDSNSDIYDNPNGPDVDRPTVFERIRITTYHNLPNTDEDYECKILTQASIIDLDDIEEVHLSVADSLRFQMDNINRGSYEFSFNPGNFGFNLHDFVNAPFYLYVYDQTGHVKRSEQHFIVRILDQAPEILYPSGTASIVSPQPTFRWREDTSPYDIQYSVTIYRPRTGTDYEIVYSAKNIPRISAQGDTADTFTVRSALPPRSFPFYYTMTVTTEDEFGNTYKSQTVPFQVAESE